jgi:hypothetical protein
MQAGNSGFSVEGTVASSTTPYYIPAGAGLDFAYITVNDLTVTNDANINTALVNNTLMTSSIVNNSVGMDIATQIGTMNLTTETTGNMNLLCTQGALQIQTQGANQDIGIAALSGSVVMTSSANNATIVNGQFSLNAADGSPLLPITIADTEPYTMISSKGYFIGQAGMTNYVFNISLANPSPFAIIQPIGNSPSNVSYWENTSSSVITVYGTGGGIPKFCMIVL